MEWGKELNVEMFTKFVRLFWVFLDSKRIVAYALTFPQKYKVPSCQKLLNAKSLTIALLQNPSSIEGPKRATGDYHKNTGFEIAGIGPCELTFYDIFGYHYNPAQVDVNK